MKSLGDFAMLQARNVFRKNVLAVEVPITNRHTRRLMEKIDRRKASKQLDTIRIKSHEHITIQPSKPIP